VLVYEDFIGGTVGDVIRFENVVNPDNLTGTYAVAFIFSDDISTGLAADVGIPATFQTNKSSILEPSNGTIVFTPSSGQAGYAGVTWGLQSGDASPVPEPATLSLLGFGLLGLGARYRAARNRS
jgi:hypothetical protein